MSRMIQRELYLHRIRPFIGSEPVKVLTGFRRSGKSVLLELIKEELKRGGVPDENIISFNFEQMRNAAFCTASALHDELERQTETLTGKVFFFFDEIQEVAQWEKCVNSCRVDFDCDIYITGSNAKLLSGELATFLGGRYVEFVVYPFSFAEYLQATRRTVANGNAEAFREYLAVGGMPFLSQLSGDKASAELYLRDLFGSAVLKDVVRRNNIRDVDLLERIVAYVLANIGHTFSATSIARYLKNENRNVSHETILNYIKACCDAFLFYRISREDLPGKKLLSVNEKYYVADHGLRAAVYGKTDQDIDQLLENVVCLELLRRGYHVTIGKIGEREIDFVAEKNGEKLYVQVAYLLATEDVVRREFDVLEEVPDNYPKYVVSMDEFDMSRNGIKHRNVRGFLLEKEWN